MNHPRTIRRATTALTGATLLTGSLCLLHPGPAYAERAMEPGNRPPSYCSSSACNPAAGGVIAPSGIELVDIAAIVDHRKALAAQGYLEHAAELLAHR